MWGFEDLDEEKCPDFRFPEVAISDIVLLFCLWIVSFGPKIRDGEQKGLIRLKKDAIKEMLLYSILWSLIF